MKVWLYQDELYEPFIGGEDEDGIEVPDEVVRRWRRAYAMFERACEALSPYMVQSEQRRQAARDARLETLISAASRIPCKSCGGQQEKESGDHYFRCKGCGRRIHNNRLYEQCPTELEALYNG